MKKHIMLAITISILVFLAACNGNSEDETLNTAENAYDNIKELVDDYSGNTTTGKTASITSTELIVTDSDNNATAYDLPAEEFFVSIAPFINETHPCDIHSLTGCQGEMTNESFDIYIEDMDGNVVLDDTINSEANGFIDLWLPRNQTFNVDIAYEGKQVNSEISTFEEDGTCITTMHLS